MMIEKKKICLVIPTLSIAGGAERIMAELANYSSTRKDLETHLVILARNKRFYFISPEVIIHEPDFDHKKYPRLVFTFMFLRYLRKTVKSINPVAVLSFEEMYSSFVILATSFLGLKIFVSDRSKPNKDWGILHNNLRRFLYRFAEGIISQTNFSKDFLFHETGNKNITIISNPIRRINIEKHVQKENIILNVGRLIKSKKHELLIDLFMQSNTTNWQLFIVGDGPEMRNLEKLISDRNIGDRVTLIGNVNNVDYYYSISKIFAFTSVSEGYPNVLGEAMAAGLPCISFDCIAGPSDLIENDITGLLIQENDNKGYIEAINNLIDNEVIREKLGNAAKMRVKEQVIEKIGPKYINFLLR